ncbi:hypothetical protein LWC34_44375 [Kibdelosporangium philippinense]|uniref:Uncharacterized protein n=2 Tax=Kibdelosporangium philippinense TaxID=211113 RepID=A0ABS8ZQD6_9PSEU|nr:hypothetical protein [Kibdelosporangium philippinense]MCE7009802.1 hypothetical protein [Kibdelosporangium philippinense]
MTQVLLDVLARPDKPNSTRLVMTDEAVTIGGKSFAWPEIDKVDFGFIDSYQNKVYVGTSFTIKVGTHDGRKATFLMLSKSKGFFGGTVDHQKRDHGREQWSRAVDILVERAGIRIVETAVAAVRGGGTAEIGGVRIDQRGMSKGRLFKKSVPWNEIASFESKYPYHHVLVRQGDKTKPRIQIANGTWNSMLLPTVIRVFAP